LRVEETTTIKRPAEQVFAFVADPWNEPRWAPAVAETRQVSPGPVQVGTTFEETVRFLGRRFEIAFEVTEYEPNRRMAVRMTSGPSRTTGVRVVEPVADGTRLTIQAEGRSGLFFGLAEPFVGWSIQRLLRKALANVKQALEEPDRS
jgi:carbon monoxide dehydrogenase subunit G